jgi:hypothetical protein
MGKLSGKGKVIVTTLRLVLVNTTNKNSDLKAFDIPHGLTFGEKFN